MKKIIFLGWLIAFLPALLFAQEKIEETALDDEERHERDMLKAKAAKPFWTTERKKLVIMLASAAVVIALAKWVQVWLRGY